MQPEPNPITRREWVWLAWAALIILACATVLNVWGYLIAPPSFQYSGLVFMTEDGNSYLAKMRQGMRGEWLFTLPYSAEPGPPFFIYLNYLLLGHLSAWLNVEPILIFHAARLLDGAILLTSLYAFVARFFTAVNARRFAFLLATLGSGFGWLAIFANHPTPDLLQTEMFPFLSILANVHFPLALAAILWLIDSLVRYDTRTTKSEWARVVGATLILAATSAYSLITIGSVSSLWLGARWLRARRLPRATLMRLIVVGTIAGLFLTYYRWVFISNPAYAGWDRQNITLSPPVWDYLIAGGFVLPLALVGVILILRRGLFALLDDAHNFLLVCWPLVIAALVYSPVAQQRKFAAALFIPLAILAVRALVQLTPPNTQRLHFPLVAFSSLTNVLLLLISALAMSQHVSSLFFTQREWNGLMYLRARADQRALVLASPQMGLFIPAWSGQRVIYGHPVETLDAKVHKEEVQNFFAGKLSNVDTFLKPVDFIFVGPRERLIGSPMIPTDFAPVFADSDVMIYQRVNE